jgi:hypothetical protein
MQGTTTGKDIFCETERLLHKYELSLNELLRLVIYGVPSLSGCKYGEVGELNICRGNL